MNSREIHANYDHHTDRWTQKNYFIILYTNHWHFPWSWIHPFCKHSFLIETRNDFSAQLILLLSCISFRTHCGWKECSIRRRRAFPGSDAQLRFDHLCFNWKKRKCCPGNCCHHWKDNDQSSKQLQWKSVGNLECFDFITPIHKQGD